MPPKFLPKPSLATSTFWAACREKKLLLQSCQVCGAIQFYPRSICTTCSSDLLDWQEAEGTGSVYSYTTIYRALVPGFEDDVPYVVAMIELIERVQLLSHIINCAPEEVYVGMPVGVLFKEVQKDFLLPVFQPLCD